MTYYCTRQRAGGLVKECRSLRPRLSADDSPWERHEKNAIIKSPHSAVCRSPTDRLELRLALLGYEGRLYTLTFDDAHLPPDFRAVRKSLRAFFARLRRARDDRPFDYVYVIEGKHGDKRYHIHLALSDGDCSAISVRNAWRNGFVHDEPLLRSSGGFRQLARYLNKESADGFRIPVGRHPWSCSRSLNRRLPPVERWKDSSPFIRVPDNAIWRTSADVINEFGEHHYASFILPPSLFT